MYSNIFVYDKKTGKLKTSNKISLKLQFVLY